MVQTMLFRILVIIMLFYLVRTFIRRFFVSRDQTRIVREKEESKELDLSQYEIEDAEYRDLEDE